MRDMYGIDFNSGQKNNVRKYSVRAIPCAIWYNAPLSRRKAETITNKVSKIYK